MDSLSEIPGPSEPDTNSGAFQIPSELDYDANSESDIPLLGCSPTQFWQETMLNKM